MEVNQHMGKKGVLFGKLRKQQGNEQWKLTQQPQWGRGKMQKHSERKRGKSAAAMGKWDRESQMSKCVARVRGKEASTTGKQGDCINWICAPAPLRLRTQQRTLATLAVATGDIVLDVAWHMRTHSSCVLVILFVVFLLVISISFVWLSLRSLLNHYWFL